MDYATDGEHGTRQTPLTALAPVVPERLEQLRGVLKGLAGELRRRREAKEQGPLDEIGTVHFARWVIVEPEGAGPLLLFTSNFDGRWDDYIEAFATVAAPVFDQIYGNCVGYPEGGARDVEAFKAYVDRHALPAQIYYSAYPEASVSHVRKALRVTGHVDALLSEFA